MRIIHSNTILKSIINLINWFVVLLFSISNSFAGNGACELEFNNENLTNVLSFNCANGLVTNPDFNNDFTGWDFHINSSISNDAYYGSAAVEVAGGAGGVGENIPALEGEIFSLEVYAKKSGEEDAVIGIKFLDEGYNELEAAYLSISSSTYLAFQLSAIAPAGTYYVQPLGWKNAGSGTAHFDGFCFQKWNLFTPLCAEASCELTPSSNNYVWSMDDSGTDDNWKDYDIGGLILCDNSDGTLSLNGYFINGHDADWHASESSICGAQDGWQVQLDLSDLKSWDEFQGSIEQHSGCSVNKIDWDFWQISGTLTGIGCNAGRSINIQSASAGYRAQIGWGGNAQSCSFGISAGLEATENGQPVQADLFAHLDATCYYNLRPEDCSNGLDDDEDGLADCYDSDCASQIAQNESFEYASGVNFDETFEGNPAAALPHNSTLLPNWKMDYGCGGDCIDSYWIDDSANLVNNPNGDYFLWMPGSSYCARQSVTVDMDKCYEISVVAAAWSVPSPQSPSTIELEAYGGGIENEGGGLLSLYQVELPASSSWQNLNWQTVKFTWSPDMSTTTNFYISQNNSSTFAKGIVIDQILIKEICCEGQTVTPEFSCGDGKDVELNFVGINNDIPNSLTLAEVDDIESIIVEVVYKGDNPGSSITVEDSDGNSYTANRQSIGSNAYVYRTTLPPTGLISYSNTILKNKAQSLSAFVYRINQPGKSVVSEFTTIGGYNNTYTLDFEIPKGVAERNVRVVLPISEITYDDRRLDFVASAGDVSTSFSRSWGPNGHGFPNGCCIDTIDFFLENVAPDVDLVEIDVISPGGGVGQSFVIAATIAAEVFCDEICGNGIDDDGDGFIDNADQDCLCPEIFVNGESEFTICGGEAVTFNLASNASNPPYSSFKFYRFNAPQSNPYFSLEDGELIGQSNITAGGSANFSSSDFQESVGSDITYYVYSIVSPSPQDPSTCFPFIEFPITVKPGIDLSINPDATVCNADTVTVSAAVTGEGPFEFIWDNDLGTGESHEFLATENMDYSVTVSSSNGCTASATTSLTVLPTPVVDAGDDVTICQSFTTIISASGSGGVTPYTFKWNNSLGNGESHAVAPNSTSIYSVTLTSDNGCLTTDEVKVIVSDCNENCENGIDDDGDGLIDCDDPDCEPFPTAGQDITICSGQSTQLAASVPGGGGSFNYSWSHGLGDGAFKNVSPASTTMYTVTVTNAAGCSGTAAVTVTVNNCPEVCTDGIDNDGDGLIDCDDPDCAAVGAPSLEDDAFETCPGLPFSNRVNLNDSNLQDPEYSIVLYPSNGAISLDQTGKFTYTPYSTGCSTDVFIYEVCNQTSGCCATAAVAITIGDNTSPLLSNVPPDITIGCDEIVPDPSIVLAYDDCPGIYIEFNEESNEYAVGECETFIITRTWAATDLCGNTASATQIITVEDLEGPEIFRVYTLANGKKLLAGESKRVTDNWKYISFPINFETTPLVFSQVASANDAEAVIVSHRNISKQGFEMRLQEQELNSDGHAIETVTWMAMEQDTSIGAFEAGLISGIDDSWHTLNLSQTFDNTPHFIFSNQTYNEPDPVTVRFRNENSNQVEIELQEEKSLDNETVHANEDVAYLSIAKNKDLVDVEGDFIGETGSLNISHAWAYVSLKKTYSKPAVIFGGISRNGGQPVTVRLRNVTSNSFEVNLQEWDYLDGSHAVENVSYLVVEGGLPNNSVEYCTTGNFKLIPGVNVHIQDNCDNTVSFDFTESSTLEENGLIVTRKWTAEDDCGNAFSFEHIDDCTVASIRLSALLMGAVMENGGGDLMRDDLRVNGLLPLTEPYTNLSNFEHKGRGGEEVMEPSLLAVEGDSALVDWAFLEIRDSANAAEVLSTAAVLLNRNGSITNFNGEEVIYFPELKAGSYSVAIRHRNHLGIMTGQPWYLSSLNIPYLDFSDLNVSVFEKQAAYVEMNGRRALWAGDLNGDRNVIYQGPYNDVFHLFSKVLADPGNVDFLANFITLGYDRTDMDMDGRIIYQGPDNERAKLLYHSILSHPINTYFLANYIVRERLP